MSQVWVGWGSPSEHAALVVSTDPARSLSDSLDQVGFTVLAAQQCQTQLTRYGLHSMPPVAGLAAPRAHHTGWNIQVVSLPVRLT